MPASRGSAVARRCIQHDVERLDLHGFDILVCHQALPISGRVIAEESVDELSQLRISHRYRRRLTKPCGCERIKQMLPMGSVQSRSGPVAQLGARFHGMEEVAGSIPARSTKSLNRLDGRVPAAMTFVSWFVS